MCIFFVSIKFVCCFVTCYHEGIAAVFTAAIHEGILFGAVLGQDFLQLPRIVLGLDQLGEEAGARHVVLPD